MAEVMARTSSDPAALAGAITSEIHAVDPNVVVYDVRTMQDRLYDSLALLEYLARYGIYADWVFGVQTRPFAAHCWVQHGDIVFNDTVEHVSGYTPIMVV